MEIIGIKTKSVARKAIECLENGGILIYPTETCYGVGVDATNEKAVSKVLEYKKRPEGKPISIGVSSQEMAVKYVNLNDTAKNIYKNFLPGPVTVVSKSKGVVDKRLESEKGTLGIRIPDYKFILDVIIKFGKPITTTSANPSGKKNPYSITDIFETTSKKQQKMIDLIIDAGELPHNPPSTVIDTTTEDLTVYRRGEVVPGLKSQVSSLTSKSVDETIKIAKDLTIDLVEKLNKGQPLIFLLYGDLGAGKTQFVKGIAKAVGINQNIKSPTYTYVSEYAIHTPYNHPCLSGRQASMGEKGGVTVPTKLYHFDAWRIQSIEDLNALNFKDWFKTGNVIAIEWPNVVLSLEENYFAKQKVIEIEIMAKGSENMRQILVRTPN